MQKKIIYEKFHFSINHLIIPIIVIIFSGFDVNQLDYPLNLHEFPDTNDTTCDSTLWSHVYTPSRLKVLQKCVELTGIIWDTPTKEGDGDYHILLRLDKGQDFYLNDKNYEFKDSCIVVEPVCAVKDPKHKNKVKTTLMYRTLYSDLPECCDNYNSTVYIPKKGEHVKVQGPLVIDEGEYKIVQHGWAEIHPVTKIEVITSPGDGEADWIKDLIYKIEKKTAVNPPLSISSYEYKGQKVYYLGADCCDQYDHLYDFNGNILCAPSGGLSGNGDGKCKDFGTESKNEKLIWKNPRLK